MMNQSKIGQLMSLTQNQFDFRVSSKPSEPLSISKPEDYEKELEEESYTITTKINRLKPI